ncbi:MAG: MotA/TolQ/ExbB proton channel family protein [Acidobacteria bacterium]|nr:MotA/TolQ/ExbB proton channel family protein [Acidobacteriota bacterium]
MARVVLLLLLGFSLFSWAVIYQKYRLFSQITQASTRFLKAFRAGKGLTDPAGIATAGTGSTCAAVYTAGYKELYSQLSGANPHGEKVKSLNAVSVSMQLAAADEVHKLEKWMSWLATTGSVTPFIGLFGTVWGVMDAFFGLGTAGAASLRAVAPGIAEALITTAAGLFTAIPAVIAYNHFLSNIREQATRMDNFALEFAAQVEKHYG